MAGTYNGGIACKESRIKILGSTEAYRSEMRRIGAVGGSKSRTGGFYVRRDLASVAGRIGGTVSRRTSKHYGNAKWREVNRKKLDVAYAHLLAVQEKAKQARQAALSVV